ncbi:MAG: porin [Planctomycetota bacterium]|nr:MAG: porin [Planctomycetota bacterium]
MKFSKLALVSAVAGLLSAGTAYAQNGWGQASSVQQTAFEYNSYYAQDYDERAGAKERGIEGTPDPQALPNQPDTYPGQPGIYDDESFGNGAGTLLDPCCCIGDEWRLFDFECLECCNTVIQGWVGWNPFVWNTTNPQNRLNGPVTFTDRANEVMFNQLYLYGEKAVDTEAGGWDIGGRFDLLYGQDFFFTTATGLETWNSSQWFGLALPQFYAEVAYNDLSCKVGHFYAPVGYEVVTMTGNFFPSLPYTFQYGEAFTFTGFIFNWQAGENVNIGAGGYNGWDNFTPDNNPNYSLIITYAEDFSDGAALAYSGTVGNEPNQAGNFSTRYVQTLVYSRTLSAISDRLDYVGQTDFGYQNDALLAGGDAYWYGLNQYLFYKVSDCMTYGIRAEWFRDQEGFRVNVPRSNPAQNLNSYEGSFYEITMGANYRYSANTVFRPYVRFDWFSGTALNGPGTLPFDSGNGNSQTLIGFDMITLF